MTEQEKSNLSSTQARGRGFFYAVVAAILFAFTPLFIKQFQGVLSGDRYR